jgi:flagellar biosynthesis chaperone FliJ
MNTKIYSIIVTVVLALAILAAGYFYWQTVAAKTGESDALAKLDQTKNELLQTQNQLKDNQEQLTSLRNLVDTGLKNAKLGAELFKDSGESFLVAGDVKVAAIGATETQAISTKIAEITDNQNRVALEDTWSKFLSSKKISDYLAFSRFLANMIQNNLENIH